MPKVHRAAPTTGVLRSHSRSSSGSKLPVNLQFTQKEQHPPKVVDKSKKNGYSHDTGPTHAKGAGRVNSGQRIHSSGQIQLVPVLQNSRNNSSKIKPGFTISTSGDEDNDEWISSESGAATPSNFHPSSESGSNDNEGSVERTVNERLSQTGQPPKDAPSETTALPRIETARPTDLASTVPNRFETRTPTLPPIKTDAPSLLQHIHSHRSLNSEMNPQTGVDGPSRHDSPHMAYKRPTTRPPSAHSIKGEVPLRPHPLIRGHSYGQIHPAKPAPLEPLTVIQDPALSASPQENVSDQTQLSTSPASSIQTTLTSPNSPDHCPSHQRRTSVSSAQSAATLPVHSTLRDSVNWSLGDRKRTVSTISHSPSSAALSSLVHLPTITRPPSPQAISFFPPVNPHANIDGIHPLLPGPYLNNHLTVLARRTPIKESFDRVIKAKHELRTSR